MSNSAFWHQRWETGADTYIREPLPPWEAAFTVFQVPFPTIAKGNVMWIGMLLPGGQLGCWLTYSKRPAVPGTFWNVNLPHLEPEILTR